VFLLRKALLKINPIRNIGLNKSKEIYMLNFIKKLFGTSATTEVKGVEANTTLEFHEEIKQQVEAEKKTFPVKDATPVKAKTKKPAAKKAPAKIKATDKPAPKKSKKQ
jgi:hypothetical protein